MKHLLFSFIFCALLIAQEKAQEVTVPPTLMFKENGKSRPLILEEVKVNVVIRGLIAETTMTMTFFNPHSRVLEGELLFPLPEGSTVCSYGLDINGSMMEGVIVEKHQARISFEKEVRKGVDPGLVEWTKGNNFRTRVYPIPASGKRTVMVQYISDLQGEKKEGLYYLPLKFKDPVGNFNLKVSVIKGTVEPKVRSGIANLAFKQWENRFVAETSLKNAQLTEDLLVALPELPTRLTFVESDEAGDTYFVVHDTPSIQAIKYEKTALKRVALLWDASLSRLKSDKSREYELLKGLCANWQKTTIDLIVFRDQAEKVKSFDIENGNAAALLDHLKGLAYDGGTSLSFINSLTNQYNFSLLFSDGLGNIGDNQNLKMASPIYSIAGDSRSDHRLLRYLAKLSGGEHFNLAQSTNASRVMNQIGVPSFSFLGAEYNEAEITDVYPNGRTLITGRLNLTGRLLVPTANVVLKYGFGNTVLERVSITLKKQDEEKTGLLPRFWAQQKVNDLAVFEEKNKVALIELGRRYGLVTPGTSLIVLETLDQYVEHNIEPPKSHPELHNQWLAKMDELWEEKNRKKADKINQLVALWNQRIEWWNADFSNWKDNVKKNNPKKDNGPAEEERAGGIETANDDMDGEEPEFSSDSRSGGGGGASGERLRRAKAKPKAESKPEIEITIKAWDPKTPYMANIKAAEASGRMYQVYLDQRAGYGDSPAYYLDCGNYFLGKGQKEIGLRILSGILDLGLENPALLRVVAYRLAQEEMLDFAIEILDEVLRLRPEEPQSYRDLALLLGRRGEANWSKNPMTAAKDFERSMALLFHVIMGHWDRFAEIETIALMELNRLMSLVERLPMQENFSIKKPALDARLRKLLTVDVRILLSWDADLTDVDLWVIEPSGEKAYYGFKKTAIGGHVSRDFTQGYGPEEYCLKKLVPGKYQIQANYYGSSQQSLIGSATVKATIFTNYGSPDEKRKEITFRLSGVKEIVPIGTVDLQGNK